MGANLYWRGEFRASLGHLERALSLYVPEAYRPMMSVVGFDARSVALSYSTCVLFILGYPSRALSRSRDTLSWARELNYPHALVHSLNTISTYNLVRCTDTEAKAMLEEQVALAEEHRISFWLPFATLMLGRVLALQGETARGLGLSRKSFADMTATHQALFTPFNLALIAQTCESVGQIDEALDLLADALEAVERTGERHSEAELHRLKGEWLLVHRRQPGEAEDSLKRALAVARRQDAKMFELRAATSVARLWRDQGKRHEARDLLAPVYGWFAEGFDTLDLKGAKALLDELSS
jgi:predicted ATPase